MKDEKERTGSTYMRRLDRAAPLFFILHPSTFILLFVQFSVNSGRRTISPPLVADSWARMPTQVQFADKLAFGHGSRLPIRALTISFTRCGCDPPWPPP